MDWREKKRRCLVGLGVGIVLAWAHLAWAKDEVIIKMATLAPQGSEWNQVMQEMGAAWQKASNGKVAFRLYSGGVAGDDADVVRKMRLGTLNAGLLSGTGLSEIDSSVLAIQLPMLYADFGEFDCVREQMGPQIEKQLDAKGFILLGWMDAGWAHFFTKTPVRTPEDMKQLKMFVWAGDDQYVELWKKAGFNPVPLPSTEISMALQTGLVNAVTSTVQGVILMQWYKQLDSMCDLRWAVFLGGVVLTKSIWDKIPADVRPAIKQAAQDACRRLSQFSRQSESLDVEVLKQQGVSVVPVDGAAIARWRQLIEGVLPQIRGSYVPEKALDSVIKMRDQCRRKSGIGGN